MVGAIALWAAVASADDRPLFGSECQAFQVDSFEICAYAAPVP